jgi:parvulin-like peptidyl-prolyl isomerase
MDRLEAIARLDEEGPRESSSSPRDRQAELRDKNTLVTRRQVTMESEAEFQHLADVFTGPELERRRREAWHKTVDRLMERALLLQAAAQAKITVSEDEVREQIQRHMARLRIQDEQHLSDRLESQGTSLGNLREDYRTRITINRFLDQMLKPPPPPSPEEILRYYAEHVGEFANPQEVQLRQIVLEKRRFPSREEAEAELRGLWTALKSGTDFGELARKHSHNPSAEQGGLFPYQAVSSLRQDLQDTIRDTLRGLSAPESASVNEALAVQETPEAFFILRIDGVRQGHPAPPAEVQAQILDQIQQADTRRRRDRVVQILRKRAYLWTAGEPPTSGAPP